MQGVPYARDSQGGGDDACEMVCNMPDIPGAELRKGSVQPQAPHAHERYAETLACFERRLFDFIWVFLKLAPL